VYSVEVVVGDKKIIIESGKLAKQADGSVTVRCGDTIVLVTAVAADKMRADASFFPLTVDYREKISAVGKFPGGYIKREGRPTEKEILTCRLTDRPIRPLFPEGYYNEVQIMSSVLSADGENDPDILAMIGASAALVISNIPFLKPVGAARVGMVDGEFIINPTSTERENSEIDLILAGTSDGVMMVEGESKGISEETLMDAIGFAHEEIKKIVASQAELRGICGKEKREPELLAVDDNLYEAVKKFVMPSLDDILAIKEKLKRQDAISALSEGLLEHIESTSEEYSAFIVKQAFYKVQKSLVRRMILDQGVRSDGRSTTDIRDITCDVSYLPRTHGSAVFTRGETQALVMATLGGSSDAQRMDGLAGETSKTFMLHYNFPPFSVGECRPNRGPGRREIGHGMLAERALQAVMPSAEDFPYVVRIISDVLESNGSSSMASVCGGTLALMDAGVPLDAPVAGIAMGLVVEDDKSVVLSDILGSEDACGDMDFKVAGTADGITAFQMDLKIEGVSKEVMKTALAQAKEGRLHILNIMNQTLEKPRESLSDYAPRIITIQIDKDKIGALIGPGGKNIKKIIEETQVGIDINDDGIVSIVSSDKVAMDDAVNRVNLIVAEPEIGVTYDAVIKNTTNFGAFAEYLPGKEGLIHISKLSEHRIADVREVVDVGDKVKVKVEELDDRGRVSLVLVSGGLEVDPTVPPKKFPPRPQPKNKFGGGRGGKGDFRKR